MDIKRVHVTFTKTQWDIIEKLKEHFGDSDADVVRNIVIAWLAEKSFITQSAKKNMKTSK